MSDEVLYEALSWLKDSKIKTTIQITGGEPLLAFEVLQKAVAYVEKEKLPATFQLQTNGSLITPEIAKFLKVHNIAIGVSLDGLPAINDLLRPQKNGKSSTAAIVEGLRTLANEKVLVGITCVVSKNNVQLLPELVDFCYYLQNVRQLGFNLLRPQGRGAEHIQAASSEELKEYVRKAFERAQYMESLTGIHLNLSQVERTCQLQQGYKPFSHCYALHSNGLYVSPHGDLYACASLSGQEDYRLGHVFTGVEAAREQALLEKLHTVVHYCEKCKDLPYCGGACYSRSDEAGKVNPTECDYKRICIEYYKEGVK